MNAEFKAKWVAALRSGNYKQGSHYLRDEDKFCCLGVACDLEDPAGWEPGDGPQDWKGRATTRLTEEFRRKIGLSTSEEEDLIHMNDIEKSFAQIADWIENNL